MEGKEERGEEKEEERGEEKEEERERENERGSVELRSIEGEHIAQANSNA